MFDRTGLAGKLLLSITGDIMSKLFSLIILVAAFTLTLSAAEPQISVVTVKGAVNPVVADYLQLNLRESARRGDRLFLVEMDTPGGLDSAMREIVKDIIASPVPVVVFVAPSGGRAASAGAIIAMAADVCAMAPGTNIGAAHPVALGQKIEKTMEEKIVNDAEAYVEGLARRRGRNTDLARKMVRESISLSAEKAMEAKLIDLLAFSRDDLLKKLDGRRVMRDGREIILQLTGAKVMHYEMGTRQKILNIISNPNVAYMLMMLGMMGLFFELSNPGVILPGVIGGISLLLAFYAFQTLPVNYAGVLLILLAVILFIAEITVVSHGMLTVGGVVAMFFGSLLLFDSPEPYLRISWNVILVTMVMTTLFFAVAITKSFKVHRKRPVSGIEGLVGEEGVAIETDIMPEGKIFVHGEYWEAFSDERIRKGEKVIVVSVNGMRLKVKRL